MPFPETPRVVYEHNPLEAVICQLRFPALLRIESEVPAAFQEAVRGKYPMLREERTIDLPVGMPSEVADLVKQFTAQRAAYEFATSDNSYVLSLTRDFMALTATAYERWEGFEEHLRVGLDALIDIYKPADFMRVGLRYRNVICRSEVGLKGTPWTQLLRPEVLGELTDGTVGPSIMELKREILVALPSGKVRIRHGLASHARTGEECYVVDEDLFLEEQTEVGRALEVLTEFHTEAGRAFRWFISPVLHDALRPRPA